MPGESHHHVEDVCLVGNTLVIGYGAPDKSVETQIETLNLNEFVNENVLVLASTSSSQGLTRITVGPVIFSKRPPSPTSL